MKRVKTLIVAFVSLLSFSAAGANPQPTGGTRIVATANATPEQAQRARDLQQRIDEIESINVAELSRKEKKELRKEMKEIRKEAKQMENVYIYFGGGFLLLLILLLILI